MESTRKTPANRRPSTDIRREEILQVAAATFAELGFGKSTTREIAERASTLSGSLYYHFSSKEAMASEVVHRYLDVITAHYRTVVSSTDPPSTKIRHMLEGSIVLSQEYRNEVIILSQDWPVLSSFDPTMSEAMSETEELWLTVIKEGIASQEFRSDLDPQVTYRTILSAMSGVPRWFRTSGPLSIQEVASLEGDLVLGGLIVPSPQS